MEKALEYIYDAWHELMLKQGERTTAERMVIESVVKQLNEAEAILSRLNNAKG